MGTGVAIGSCARCGQVRRVWARGLCTTCYPVVHRAGELVRFPLVAPRRAGPREPRGQWRGKPARARALGAARRSRARARAAGYEALRRQEWLAARAGVA